MTSTSEGDDSFRMPQTNGSLTSGHSSSASEASEAKQSLSKKENVICTEVFDENSSPTKDGKPCKIIANFVLFSLPLTLYKV